MEYELGIMRYIHLPNTLGFVEEKGILATGKCDRN